MIENKPYYSIAEVAEESGRSRQWIYNHIEYGHITTIELGAASYIDRAQALRIIRKAQKVGPEGTIFPPRERREYRARKVK